MDEDLLKKLVDEGLTLKDIAERMGKSYSSIRVNMKRLGLKSKYIHVHSEEEKETISRKRKAWLAENPEKHPWKNPGKFTSTPCENIKKILRDKGIPFAPEFPPDVEGRYFSVDIAFPDRKIIWEINGNQHYEKDGSLKPYYQERHDLLVAAGWTVYEIPYTCCFKPEKIDEFISLSLDSPLKVQFDYFNYTPKKAKETKDDCPNCENQKLIGSALCRLCCDNNKIGKYTKISWPTIEEMKSLVFEKPTVQIASDLGVSDVAIARFCKNNNIPKPPRGYWAKKNGATGGIRTPSDNLR